MAKMKWYDWTGYWLLVIGGFAWLGLGVFKYNFVTALFGRFERVIYTVVGAAAIFATYTGLKLALEKK